MTREDYYKIVAEAVRLGMFVHPETQRQWHTGKDRGWRGDPARIPEWEKRYMEQDPETEDARVVDGDS